MALMEEKVLNEGENCSGNCDTCGSTCSSYDPEKQTMRSQSFPAGTALQHGSVVEVPLIDSDEAFLGRY